MVGSHEVVGLIQKCLYGHMPLIQAVFSHHTSQNVATVGGCPLLATLIFSFYTMGK